MHFRAVFTADIHGYLFPTDYVTDPVKEMGLLRLMPHFQRDNETLLLDGGDTIQGSPLTSWAHRENAWPHPCAKLFNLAGYDYVTIGNHDLDYGTDYYCAYLRQLKAKCVCANIRDREGKLPVLSSVVHTLPNGLKIGVTGVCTQQLMRWEKKDVLSTLIIEDPVLRAGEELQALRDECDLTVCIYHGGFSRDPVTGKTLSVGLENQGESLCDLGFDLVLCAHQHRSMPGRRIGRSFAVQVPSRGTECCILDATGQKGAWQIECSMLRASCEPSEEGIQLLQDEKKANRHWLDSTVGSLDRPLLPEAPLHRAYFGSPMANLINQVQNEAAGTEFSACSLPNAVSPLPETVSIRDILSFYPHPNTLVVLHMRMKDLRRYLEQCAAYFALDEQGNAAICTRYLEPKAHHYHYDFLYGLNYEVDVCLPEGGRVGRILRESDGTELRPDEEIDVCFSSYRASGIGGFDFLKSLPVVREIRTPVRSLIISYFERRGRVETDGRNPVHFKTAPKMVSY